VTVTHPDWSPTLAAGGSAEIGFTATTSGGNAAPAVFTLNGTACSVS
jgi:hypothetical protein